MEAVLESRGTGGGGGSGEGDAARTARANELLIDWLKFR